jgi:hypothetical protein
MNQGKAEYFLRAYDGNSSLKPPSQEAFRSRTSRAAGGTVIARL